MSGLSSSMIKCHIFMDDAVYVMSTIHISRYLSSIYFENERSNRKLRALAGAGTKMAKHRPERAPDDGL